MNFLKKYGETLAYSIIFPLILLLLLGAADGSLTNAEPVGKLDLTGLAPIWEALTGKFGWLAAIPAWVGIARFTFMPLMTAVHSFVEKTPSTRDDVILAKIEASPAIKTAAWVLNLLLSIKVGPEKPIPAALAPEEKVVAETNQRITEALKDEKV